MWPGTSVIERTETNLMTGSRCHWQLLLWIHVEARRLRLIFDVKTVLTLTRWHNIHCVSKNVPPLACYNFDTHEWILIFFGRNVTDKVRNEKLLYYATLNNLCFCTTWQNGETRKSHFSLNWTALHAQCTCVLSSWKKKLSSVTCLMVSNICWDSEISH